MTREYFSQLATAVKAARKLEKARDVIAALHLLESESEHLRIQNNGNFDLNRLRAACEPDSEVQS